ncbi:hypothetical protein CVT26_010208 [Gymnopilus dilepis]|uniref:Uncharacterized protein n=1 Tax=Gymnopilus dilepis TaxID=231916 RepID=A0A409W4R3_9AGAR|nr:hypothetical protein CVT26_010208 [Gymnopilus dilepis]
MQGLWPLFRFNQGDIGFSNVQLLYVPSQVVLDSTVQLKRIDPSPPNNLLLLCDLRLGKP